MFFVHRCAAAIRKTARKDYRPGAINRFRACIFPQSTPQFSKRRWIKTAIDPLCRVEGSSNIPYRIENLFPPPANLISLTFPVRSRLCGSGVPFVATKKKATEPITGYATSNALVLCCFVFDDFCLQTACRPRTRVGPGPRMMEQKLAATRCAFRAVAPILSLYEVVPGTQPDRRASPLGGRFV